MKTSLFPIGARCGLRLHRPQSSHRLRGLAGGGFFCLLALGSPLRAAELPGGAGFSGGLLDFSISTNTGAYAIRDRASGAIWRSNPYQPRFGEAELEVAGGTVRVPLDRCTALARGSSLELTFRPLAQTPYAWLRVDLALMPDGRGLRVAYEADPAVAVRKLRLLDQAFGVSAAEDGAVLVPVREGLLIPADSGKEFSHTFTTYAYEGCHMAMLGVMKRGAAVLLHWRDPYVAAEVRSALTNATGAVQAQTLTSSLVLEGSARVVHLRFLERGDAVGIGQAYREVARREGWLVPWSAKLAGNAGRAKLLGASNYKLWSVLDRRMNEDSSKEERVTVNWTFDEAAQVAEHLKRDLQLEKVLFLMGGWIHRGYDNQHPDILPAAPECGGDAAFADCARRVMALGYVFGLHDNYQDIYRDSPSWNEDYIMKKRDGSLARGGHWAGGMAYLTCSKLALELARRPQNLPAVKRLTGADAYFIDTTYAAGLMECFDSKHPLTRLDDLRWKQAISDYARDEFGIFGSECGREWAIPHCDFFEGLTGVSGRHYHDTNLEAKVGGVVVPLFEIVYRDCLAMYGKYGYDIRQAAGYVLDHLVFGRPLHYHNVPRHRYWLEASRSAAPSGGGDQPDPAVFVRGDDGWSEGLHPYDRFVKNTHEILSPLNELTAQLPMIDHRFLDAGRTVQRVDFGAGRDAVTVTVNASRKSWAVQSGLGGEVVLPPFGFLVESAGFVAFHAERWGGQRYASPALFTLRSLDGQPIERSGKVRVFHGFGDSALTLRDRAFHVPKEAVIDARPGA